MEATRKKKRINKFFSRDIYSFTLQSIPRMECRRCLLLFDVRAARAGDTQL